MYARQSMGLSLLVWIGVWAFWLGLTHRYHPTLTLAVIVTTALVSAYAIAAYVNHIALIPRLWRTGRKRQYAAVLAVVMVALTGCALAIIRFAYFQLAGPDPDPRGAYKHFAIDLFGMAVHLTAAWVVVRAVSRLLHSGLSQSPKNP